MVPADLWSEPVFATLSNHGYGAGVLDARPVSALGPPARREQSIALVCRGGALAARLASPLAFLLSPVTSLAARSAAPHYPQPPHTMHRPLVVSSLFMWSAHDRRRRRRRQRQAQGRYISVDMEGVAGVVTADQLLPGGFEYERFRGFMTAEALAAIQGARDAGATEFVVSDSHGNQENMLIEQFPADATIIRSSPRPLGMMEGIDSSFAAVVFIGYHASTTSPAGVRAHTFSSASLTAVQLNGTLHVGSQL